MQIEVQNTSTTGPLPNEPPLLAFKHSVLSLFAQMTVSTDQGQTIVNDQYTQMINMVRLEVENDYGWVWSESQELDFGLDQAEMLPTSVAVTYSGIKGPSYAAFQGLEPGALNGAPLTNDLNEFGNVMYGLLPLNVTTASSSAGTGTLPVITFPQVNWTGNSATAPNAGFLIGTFPDGRAFSVPFSSGTTNFTASAGVLTWTPTAAAGASVIGGIDLNTILTNAQAVTAGLSFVVQAIGYTTVLNQPLQSETVTVPLGFTTTVTAGHFALTSIGTAPVTAIANVNAAAQGQSGARNPNFNRGFLDRVTVFQNDASYTNVPVNTQSPASKQTLVNGGHVWSYVAKVPLKLLHDFWLQLNIPIINVGWNITLFLNQPNGLTGPLSAQFPPLQTSANSAILTNGTDTTANPTIWYGTGPFNGTRLYYRSIKFSPADNARAAQMLTTGFTKSIKFISTDWIQQSTTAPTDMMNSYRIANSVVHPLRLWILGYLSTTAAVPVLSIGTYWHAAAVVNAHYDQCNVLVNNIPYRRQPMQTQVEQWEELAEQFDPDNGSMIRYVDFAQYKRWLMFDLTRLSDRLQSPTEPVDLLFQGTRNDKLAGLVQNYYLIERLNQVTFRFSSADVAIVVGNMD